jgi:fructokinase
MFDISAVGELLIDFTPAGVSEAGNTIFERNPGGAPANVLAAASKLGASTAFLGKVGNDQFGRFLEKTLKDNRIDTRGLKFSPSVNTTLAFVHLDGQGDRSFSFYRSPGADMMLSGEDLDEHVLKTSNIFHFGSVSMTDEPSRSATLQAVGIAKNSGAIISFDPNLRPLLWKSQAEAKKQILSGLGLADILKISEEELEFLTGERDLENGTRQLQTYGIKLIIVTLGPAGAFYRSGNNTGFQPTYDVAVVDTTGAGDAFLGAFLFRIRNLDLDGISRLSPSELDNMVEFANAAGACTTVKKGGIPAVPGLDEVERCMREVPRTGSKSKGGPVR